MPLVEQGVDISLETVYLLVQKMKEVQPKRDFHRQLEAIALSQISIEHITRCACPELYKNFDVNDIVYVSPDSSYVLRSGCSEYHTAIVLSVEPFVLASQSGDMRWSATVRREDFLRFRAATPEEIEKVKHRLRG